MIKILKSRSVQWIVQNIIVRNVHSHRTCVSVQYKKIEIIRSIFVTLLYYSFQ